MQKFTSPSKPSKIKRGPQIHEKSSHLLQLTLIPFLPHDLNPINRLKKVKNQPKSQTRKNCKKSEYSSTVATPYDKTSLIDIIQGLPGLQIHLKESLPNPIIQIIRRHINRVFHGRNRRFDGSAHPLHTLELPVHRLPLNLEFRK